MNQWISKSYFIKCVSIVAFIPFVIGACVAGLWARHEMHKFQDNQIEQLKTYSRIVQTHYLNTCKEGKHD